MSDGFSAFRAMAIGVGILFAGASIAPNVADGQFDLLRIVKGKGGKGRSTLPPTEPAPTEPSTGGGTTTTTPPPTTTNGFYTEETMVTSNFDIGIGADQRAAAVIGRAGRGRRIPVRLHGRPSPEGRSHRLSGPARQVARPPILRQHVRERELDLSVAADDGQSTCMSPLNRSAYWMPAMLDGKGNVVRPDHVTIYYKRRPISDPKCSLTSGDPKAEGNCVPLPNGLRFVFGYDMLTGNEPDRSDCTSIAPAQRQPRATIPTSRRHLPIALPGKAIASERSSRLRPVGMARTSTAQITAITSHIQAMERGAI